MDSNKNIQIVGKHNRYHMKKITQGKEQQVLLKTNKDFPDNFYTHEIQCHIIRCMDDLEKKRTPIPVQYTEVVDYLYSQISGKISSYKMQDKIKKRDISGFVKKESVIELLCRSELRCTYCLQHMSIIYKYNREYTQWTLDRLDNDVCHTLSNVKVSCLKCNLDKKRRGEKAFTFTKQLSIVKTEDDEEIQDTTSSVFEEDVESYEQEQPGLEEKLVFSDIEYSNDT
tara:strand:+ start:1755 stop:2435 length:681 start_codon:yes stop_codon:yes gene_type:complete